MDAFIYTKDFYIALYKQLEKGMTAIEAYESLGFNTKTLEKTVRSLRPNEQDKKARNGEFEPKADNFDGSVPIEEMPEMSLEEKSSVSGSSYQIFGRLRRISKKNAIHIGGDILIVQRQEVKDDKFYMAYDYIKRGKAEQNGYTNTKVFKMFGISSTGYYNYVARKEDRNGKLAAKKKR